MSAAEIGRVTDPLSEFASFVNLLRGTGKDQAEPAFRVIGSMLDKTYKQDGEFAAYAIINRRANNLKYIISMIPETTMDDALKADVIGSISSVQAMFAPDMFNTPWRSVVANLQERHTVAFKYAARDVLRYYPIREMTKTEVAEAQNLLGEALQEIMNDDYLPQWLIDPLLIGVQDLLFAIDNIYVLGQDEVAQTFMLLHAKARGVSEEAEKQGLAPYKLVALAAAFVFIGDVITTAPNIAQALPWWRDAFNHVVKLEIPFLRAPTLQIEGPKATEPT